MAFGPFGRKKLSSHQDQNQSGSGRSSSHAEIEAAIEPVGKSQQQTLGPDTNSGAGPPGMTSELASLNAADRLLGMNCGEVGATGEIFPDAVLCQRPTIPALTTPQPVPELLDPDIVRSIPQIMEHNVALRRNFDALKELHLQLSESHAQLREAYTHMQNDQRTSQAKELTLLKNNEITTLAHELEQRNQALEKNITTVQEENRDLMLRLDRVRKEKEEVMMAKHTAEMQYTRELSIAKVDDRTFRQQAADLSHKCKHLEIDLEKSVSAGDALQQQLVSLAYEKDSTIMDLEQALRRVREDFQSTERRYRAHESEWEDGRKILQSKLDDKDRQEQTMRSTIKEETELRLQDALKEVSDLRAMVVTLEKPRADAELFHMETVRELTKELETLRQEMGKAVAAERAARDRLAKLESIELRLDASLKQGKDYLDEISHLKRASGELENEAAALKCEVAELGAIRDVECKDHAKQLEILQRRWASENSAAVQKAERNAKQIQEKCTSRISSLKKKLKETQKLLATVTVDRNHLLVRSRESEAQLAIFQAPKLYTPVPTAVFPNAPLSMNRIVGSPTTAGLTAGAAQEQQRFLR